MRVRCILPFLLLLSTCVILLPTVALAGSVEYSGPILTAGAEEGAVGVVPPTLAIEQAIEIALQYNPQVAASEQGIYASQGVVTQALSFLMPRVDVQTARTTPVDIPPFSFQSPDSSWQTDLSLSQPLYTAGALPAGVRAVRELLRGSEGAYRRTRHEVAFSVRGAYYAVLAAEEQVNVAQQVLDSALETLRVSRLRYEAGVAPQFDVLSAEARVARTEQAFISAEVLRDTVWATLSTTLGVPIPPGTRLSTPRPVTVSEADPVALRAEALANRPDLLVANADEAAARAQLAVAKAGNYPTISGNISYSLRERVTVAGDVVGTPGIDIVVSQNSGAISLVATWSIFNAGQVEGEITEAKARHQQSQDVVKGLRQSVELGVRTAYLAVEAAKAQVAAARKEVTQQEEAYRIATIRYQEGVGTSVEILSAEADLEDAKTRLNRAIFDLNLAVARLDLALGRDALVEDDSEPEMPSE
jgi:outer membrane protein